MTKPRVLLCLPTRDNDYQQEQALEAERVAQALEISLTIIDAQNDALNQSQLLLTAIQSSVRPDAIIFEPVSGTGLPVVARAAVSAGIGLGVLNREVEYLKELRNISKNGLIFGIGNDHMEIGRIQAAQIENLLPKGGEVLLIEGPNENAAAHQRTEGFREKKAANITCRRLRGKWSQESGKQAIVAWSRLCTSRQSDIAAVIAHNDYMAVGAKRAFDDLPVLDRKHWMDIPFIGVDGLARAGLAWINQGLLKATVLLSPVTGLAVRAAAAGLRTGERPPTYTFITPFSYPELPKVASIN